MSQTRTSRRAPLPRGISYEDYLRDPTIGSHTEWVEGEVIPMMAVSKKHAELKMYLTAILLAYLETHPTGQLYDEPFQMKSAPALPGRSPDLMFVRDDHLDRVRDLFLDGPADLVVEIVSPGSEVLDHGAKFFEYEAAGVSEYWILDPHREVADFYVRDETGVFRSANVLSDGIFTSIVIPGLAISVEWLWERRPLRQIRAALGLGS